MVRNKSTLVSSSAIRLLAESGNFKPTTSHRLRAAKHPKSISFFANPITYRKSHSTAKKSVSAVTGGSSRPYGTSTGRRGGAAGTGSVRSRHRLTCS